MVYALYAQLQHYYLNNSSKTTTSLMFFIQKHQTFFMLFISEKIHSKTHILPKEKETDC